MSTKSIMSIKTFLQVAPRLPGTISVLIRGKHGIGKSQLIAQLAAEDTKCTQLIDRRLSQMSEGDMIGLPELVDGVTRFCPPDWFIKACTEPVYLCLDEFNRALPEVMQAAFQIVLDRELNGHKLHPGTRVFAAVNVGAEYSVNEIDPALLRRFWVVDLAPDVEEWTEWARGRLSDITVDFFASNPTMLDPAKGADLTEVHCTRHSVERCDTSLRHMARMIDPANDDLLEADDPLFYPTCVGFLGVEVAIAFRDFVKNVDRRITGEEILTSYPKVRGKVLKLGQEKWNICIEKLCDVIDKTPKVTNAMAKNVELFMKDLPGELRIALWSKLTAKGISKVDSAKSVWRSCMPLVLDVFGVKPGEEGVGMIPTIPGLNLPGSKDSKK